jgi:hypothetical protein
MKRTDYKVAQDPHDHLWYVVGYAGGGYWIPVSCGYQHRAAADHHAKIQPRIDADARRLVAGV